MVILRHKKYVIHEKKMVTIKLIQVGRKETMGN